MSIAAVFAVVFLLLVGITLVVPSLPPAQTLYEYLKIPETELSIWGYPIATLLHGIINGLIWVTVSTAVYAVARRAGKSDPLPPLPKPPELQTPPPEPMPANTSIKGARPITVRSKPIRFGQDFAIETIDGIGPVYGKLLRNSGISTVKDLLRASANKQGRIRLAHRTGLSYTTLQKWVHRGDLLRVRGIGKKYSKLLESAGVNTIADLSTRNPRFLYQTLREVNRERNLVRRTPPSKTVELWVNNAKTLEPIVE
jgi:predicted flap endonuclease-1-like 5' DNA nuclease